MVEKARGGGAAETRTEFFQKRKTEFAQARVFELVDLAGDEFVIGILPRAQVGRSGEEPLFFLAFQCAKTPLARLESELRVEVKLAFEKQTGTDGERTRRIVLPVVRPNAQREAVARIAKLDLDVGLVAAGGFFDDGGDNNGHGGTEPSLLTGRAQRGDFHGFQHRERG